jgi:serralysin
MYNAALTVSTNDDRAIFNAILSGADTFILSSGADWADGRGGNDQMYGNGGNDALLGGGGDDRLFGGSGNDKLVGGSGNDRLTGGTGRDNMTGNVGADSFIFTKMSDSAINSAKSDVIVDFTQGQDKIDLSFIDASAIAGGNNTFVFRGTTAFTDNNTGRGEVYFRQFDNSGTSNDFTLVYLDNDNDAGAESIIRLTGLYNLTASDFIL